MFSFIIPFFMILQYSPYEILRFAGNFLSNTLKWLQHTVQICVILITESSINNCFPISKYVDQNPIIYFHLKSQTLNLYYFLCYFIRLNSYNHNCLIKFLPANLSFSIPKSTIKFNFST